MLIPKPNPKPRPVIPLFSYHTCAALPPNNRRQQLYSVRKGAWPNGEPTWQVRLHEHDALRRMPQGWQVSWRFSLFLTCLFYRSGELRMQKLKSHLVRTQNLNVLHFKPGVGRYIAIHATLTARDFFLAYFYTSGPFTCIFSKPLPIFSCVGCG